MFGSSAWPNKLKQTSTTTNKYIFTCNLARISWLKRANGGIAPGRLGSARGPMLWSGYYQIIMLWSDYYQIIMLWSDYYHYALIRGRQYNNFHHHSYRPHFSISQVVSVTCTGAGGAGLEVAASFLLIVWPSPGWCCSLLLFSILLSLILLLSGRLLFNVALVIVFSIGIDIVIVWPCPGQT